MRVEVEKMVIWRWRVVWGVRERGMARVMGWRVGGGDIEDEGGWAVGGWEAFIIRGIMDYDRLQSCYLLSL